MIKCMFSGHVKKAESRNAKGKTMLELSICKKNRSQEGAEPSFTWLKVIVWDPKPFQVAAMSKGAFISGCGDMSLKSFQNKDGVKQQVCEVFCQSFDVDAPDERQAGTPQAVIAQAPSPKTKIPAPEEDFGSPPF